MNKLVVVLVFLATTFFTSNFNVNAQGTVTDVDGNTYQTVVIGEQEWMAEDLRVTKYRNGDALLFDKSFKEWQQSVEGIWAYYDNDPTNNNLYGKLYNWYATVDPRGLCPTGWRTPTDYDWQMLEEFIDPTDRGNKNDAGKKLKSRRQVNSPFGGEFNTTEHPRWDDHPVNFGTDDYNFNSLPGGGYTNGNAFRHKGQEAYYWSSTEAVQGHTWTRILTFSNLGTSRGQLLKSLGASVRCVKGVEQTFQVPQVNTVPSSNVTLNSATCGGDVLDDGGAPVTSRGVVWSTTQNPKIDDYLGITTNGSGLGQFTSELTGLNPGSTYWVRAYATNSSGTGYGIQIKVLTLTQIGLPTVTTSQVTNITTTSAVGGGNVTSDGGVPVTTRGVVWSTSQDPTLQNNEGFTTNGSGTGVFYSSLTNLLSDTIYYVKAYATNGEGTAYGSQLSFETLDELEDTTWTPCPDIPTVEDIDGNVYNTIQIGDQCWIRENLKTTKYYDGTPITLITGISNWSALTETSKAYCWYYDNSNNGQIYGALYTWAAAMNGASSSKANSSGIQGVCPTDWHLPSDNEWKTLEIYLGISPSDAEITGLRGTTEGGELKETGTTHWNSPNTGANNESGFSALGSGYRGGTGYFDPIGNGGFWWSSTEFSTSNAYYRGVYYNNSLINRYYLTKKIGFSIRCVKNTEPQPTNYSITININPEGTGTATGAGEYESGAEVPLTATANQGYQFVNWILGGEVISTEASFTYTIPDEDVTLSANFEELETTFTCGDSVTFIYNGEEVTYGTVVGANGRCWLDKNLGAGRVAQSSTDEQSYGDLFQWGRDADGHQVRTSNTTSTLSDSNNPEHGDFIIGGGDWLSSQNDNLWQDINGVNNPCPTGFRIPILDEWEEERVSWISNNSEGAFLSPLKLTLSGSREGGDGLIYLVAQYGMYWSSDVMDFRSRRLEFNNSYANVGNPYFRSMGYTVRCIMDDPTGPTTYNLTFTISPEGSGTATGAGEYEFGTEVALTASPNSGYQFVNWTIGGEIVSNEVSFNYTMPAIDVTITANFEEEIIDTYGQPCPDTPTVTDIDGNIYNTVQIGEQCWMKENLAWLPSVSPSNESSYDEPLYYVWGYQGNDVETAKSSENYTIYGTLYNWAASLSACPTGWHLPSDAEWTILSDFLGGITNAGGKMKEVGTTYWKEPNTGATNESGFSGLGGGNRFTNLEFNLFLEQGVWWTSTAYYGGAWERALFYNQISLSRGTSNGTAGHSVRCIKD